MSEGNGAPTPNLDPQQIQVQAQLVVNLLMNGKVMVQGEVLQNAVVSYGMLIAAQHAIKEWHAAQAAQKRVELVGAMPGLKVKE